jgi:transcriptional regulator with XRE-family HTH domain
MKDRLLEFLRIENKSSAQFAEEIGVQPSSISHILSGRNNPSLDFVLKMLNKYPALSTDWLLFGKGSMYKGDEPYGLFSGQLSEKEEYRTDLKEAKNESFVLNNDNPAKGTGESVKKQIKDSDSNRTRRIICFFVDHTFREYFPGD